MELNSKSLKAYSKVALFVVCVPLSGCYAYMDSSIETLTPGTAVRVRLDEDSFGRVLNQAASDGYDARRLDARRRGLVGRVTETTGDSLSILLRGAGGSVYTARMPNWAISESAVRQFDLKKTGLVVAGFSAFTVAAFGGGWFGGTTSRVTPEGPQMMTTNPIISIPFP